LSNTSIEKMARARLGDDVIVSMIQSQAGHYDVTPDSFIAIKREGISDRVLAAMAAKGNGMAPAQLAPGADSYEDLDIGVYRRTRSGWIPVASEQVNWKTSGALKSIATDGIIKGDVNGRLNGGASATQMNMPLDFLIKTPDGIEATDFQLVHLHEKTDAREFRTMTGGVFIVQADRRETQSTLCRRGLRSISTRSGWRPIFPEGNMRFWHLGLPILRRAALPARHMRFDLWSNEAQRHEAAVRVNFTHCSAFLDHCCGRSRRAYWRVSCMPSASYGHSRSTGSLDSS
jgi:hypothetical protein